MLDFAIATIVVLALAAMSLRASERFGDDRLPMQWSLDGKVTASAPRGFALALMPLLSVVVLGAIAALAVFGTPGHRQGDGATLALVLAGAGLIACHAFHLWMTAVFRGPGSRCARVGKIGVAEQPFAGVGGVFAGIDLVVEAGESARFRCGWRRGPRLRRR